MTHTGSASLYLVFCEHLGIFGQHLVHGLALRGGQVLVLVVHVKLLSCPCPPSASSRDCQPSGTRAAGTTPPLPPLLMDLANIVNHTSQTAQPGDPWG